MPSANLLPNLREKFNAVIWKIEIDEENDIVAIETRDHGAHSALFSTFNYLSGECYFKEQSTENSWWWGLDRAQNNLIYLHGYKSEGSPEHRGIIAWDAASGNVQWQNFNYTLDGISDAGLVVHNPLIQSSKPELLSPETGQIIREDNYTLIHREILFPESFSTSVPRPAYIPKDIAGPLLHINHNNKSCWAYHTKTATGFTQTLLISENDTVIVSENLSTDIQKLNPEAFFIQKNQLFCVGSNNYEIISYLL